MNTNMQRRNRLNFLDTDCVRADELKVGDRFLDTAPWWSGDGGDHLVIREITAARTVGDDVEFTTACGRDSTTSIGNTFLLVNGQQSINQATQSPS